VYHGLPKFLSKERPPGNGNPGACIEESWGFTLLKPLGFKVNPVTGGLEEVSPEGGYLLGLK
jgi:hypothetical protein